MECFPIQLWHDLGRSWSLVLLDELSSGPKGFNDLLRTFSVSNKVLSQRLDLLESYGLISRVYDRSSSVVTVAISLTQKGSDFLPVLSAFRSFVKKYDSTLPCGSTRCSECEFHPR